MRGCSRGFLHLRQNCFVFPRALLSIGTAGCPLGCRAALEGRVEGWLSSEGHSPPAGCRWCSCSQGHFRSSFSLQTCSLSRQPLEFLWKTSASHSPCKQQRHPERSLTLHRVKADSAEATAESWSYISIISRNNSVSPSATSSFCVFLLWTGKRNKHFFSLRLNRIKPLTEGKKSD